MSVSSAPGRVLVTGAAGLVGRAVIDDLRAHGVAVTALDQADPGDLPVDRVVVGDAADPDTVRGALADVDAVAHLAARPSPGHGTPLEVFQGNTAGTFNVLEEAGRAGIRRAMTASSYSILGLSWASEPGHPAYLPIDERHPLVIEDPYGLSKQADECTGQVMVRRHGMTVVALRFPFIVDQTRLKERLAATIADPGSAAADCWAYLDVRDAATATRLALTAPISGFHALFVAAPRILAPYATEALLAAYHPATPLRRPIPGHDVPIDLTAAREVLGFTARHTAQLEMRQLPETVRGVQKP
jgi:nucleoside-diphosphate-sugar epimerase